MQKNISAEFKNPDPVAFQWKLYDKIPSQTFETTFGTYVCLFKKCQNMLYFFIKTFFKFKARSSGG